MYARNDTALFNPRGLMIYDPLINQFPAQADLPAVPFVDWLAPVFGLNASFMGYLHEQHRRCGFEAFLAQNLLFPPTSFPLPSPPPATGGCDLWDQIFEYIFSCALTNTSGLTGQQGNAAGKPVLQRLRRNAPVPAAVGRARLPGVVPARDARHDRVL